MSLLAWIVLGLIAGYLASSLYEGTGHGLSRDLVLGTLGAVAGGVLYSRVGAATVSSLDVYGLLIAIASAGLLLAGYHTLRRRSPRPARSQLLMAPGGPASRWRRARW